MKCEDVWPNLETGGWWRRWRATVHIRRCSRCAAEAELLQDFRQQMATSRPLSAEQRELWLAAVETPSVQPRSRVVTWTRVAIGATAVAACVALAIVVWFERRGIPAIPPGPGGRSVATVTESPVQAEEVDVSEELARLAQEISRSEAELRDLVEQARLRQAGRELEILLAKYERN